MRKRQESPKTIHEELELIFLECQREIDEALREHEDDVRKAMKELEEGIQAHTRLAS